MMILYSVIQMNFINKKNWLKTHSKIKLNNNMRLGKNNKIHKQRISITRLDVREMINQKKLIKFAWSVCEMITKNTTPSE